MIAKGIISLITALLLLTACTSENYYRKQAALYREAIEKATSATTGEELEAINEELCDKLLLLENESVDEKAMIKERISKDGNAYKEELDELLRLQREYIDITYNKLHMQRTENIE